jgi:hypothetical protein
MKISSPVILLFCFSLLINLQEVHGEIRTLVIGNQERLWATWGTLDAVDDSRRPGWIQPRRISREVNLLNELYRQGRLYPFERPVETTYRPGDGRVWTPNAPFQENRDMLRLADGLKDSVSFNYFNRLASNNGVSIYVDLGAPFPVDEIRFYPLNFGVHQDLYLKGYELFANDGSPETLDARGIPVYRLLDAVPVNPDVNVINTNFPPQFIRYLRLRSTSPQPFEIDQLEIRGEGFVRRATFTSHVLDLGDLANLGALRWTIEEQAGAQVSIQTRVGTDKTTLIYNEINEFGEEEPLLGETDEENLNLWKRLPEGARGSVVDDTDNWTLWSPPYDSSGQQIVALGPRQHIQIRITMESIVATARVQVDSIAFEFSQPVAARRLVGEISPRVDIDLGVPRTFTYRVKPTIDRSRNDTGFDVLQILIPTRASVSSVKIRDRVLPADAYETTSEDRQLTIRLTSPNDRITSNSDSLEVTFSTTVFTYGTVFEAMVLSSWRRDTFGQLVENVSVNDVTIQGAEASLGIILRDVEVTPNPFTPNGDGRNDRATISFKIFQVIGTTPVSVTIYNTSGIPVKTLLSADSESGEHKVIWDGTDNGGLPVAPGLYLYRIVIDGDEQSFAKMGTIAVVY